MIPLIAQAKLHKQRTAVFSNGKTYSYGELLRQSGIIADWLLDGSGDLNEARIAFLIRPSFEYVVLQWAIWRAGGIAVPLCTDHPIAAIRHVLDDCTATCLIVESDQLAHWKPLGRHIPLRIFPQGYLASDFSALPDPYTDGRAMILYTSGTTNKPKGVVFKHDQLTHQISCLANAWQWQSSDHILNVLPLHHVHGIINVICCALWSGAAVEFIPKFEADLVWKKFATGCINVFMAVPTIYYKLIEHWSQIPDADQIRLRHLLPQFRLMVSGSAALPVSILEEWRRISGHVLLERYGMTEIGMALSNPYQGERRPGFVGWPLPGIDMRLVDERGHDVGEGTPGEIQVKGPSVFREYWNNEPATREAFTADGWFKTGDVAVQQGGYYKILGRDSIDIIKSGGYKISAIEVEDAIRAYPGISDCAVVGIPDLQWGQIVSVALVDDAVEFTALKQWLKDYLPEYKIPRRHIKIKALPRTVIGKVTKKELIELFT